MRKNQPVIYYVMHKNRRVAKIDTVGQCKVYYKTFMPYDLVLEESDDIDDRLNNLAVFYHWCSSRMLTLDRKYAKEILNSIGASQSSTDKDRAQIALSYHCLSLTDVYWVMQKGSDLSFEKINLYQNSLSNSFVDIALRGHQMSVTNSYLLANDLSTNGCYPKAWVRDGSSFLLYKNGGSEVVFREVLASKICRCFKCHQVLYEAEKFNGVSVSASKIMSNQDYSLVSYASYDIYCLNHDWNTLDRILRLDAYGYYMMNILDYLIGNTDRHRENWGLLVDNQTNRPVRLHDLMDFNYAFTSYDSLEGANCLTDEFHRLSQKEAAIQAVKKIGLNQISEIDPTIFEGNERLYRMFEQRLSFLQSI